MPASLSPTMQAALDAMKAHGGTLERFGAGYWTWPDCPAERSGPTGELVPTVYFGLGTAMALVDRGLAAVANRHCRSSDPTRIVLTGAS